MPTVRQARTVDAESWERMRHALWPDSAAGEHRGEIERFFRGEFPRGPWTALVAESEKGEILGFAEVSIRPYAEGCRTNRVGYLEGWYVMADAREQGVGRALVEASECWARTQGCCEFASDAEADNDVSAAAHRALGFEDMGLVRCFRKDL